MRLPWPALAGGVVVAVVGAAGLIRGATPQAAANDAASAPSGDPVVVGAAYVRPPVPPTKLAAAYFTVYNRTAKADRITSVTTGAGASATLHVVDKTGAMRADGALAVVPAKGKLTLSSGRSHLMIGSLFGPLRKGDRVNIQITLRDAGSVDFVAPVVPFGEDPPAAAQPSGEPS